MADWLDFLTGVGSLFTGSKDDKTSTKNKEDMTLKGEQSMIGSTDNTTTSNQLSDTTSTGTQDTSTNQNTNTSSIGSTDSTNTTKQSTDTSQSSVGKTNATSVGTNKATSVGTSSSVDQTKAVGTQTETTSAYSKQVMDQLNSLLGATMQTGNTVNSALTGQLSRIQQEAGNMLNVDNFVKGVVGAAGANTQMDLESRINGTLSQTGSTEGGNSMAALLGNRMRNDAAASLGGIASEARAQGEQIRMQQQQSLTQQIGSVAGQLGTQLQGLLDAAKGGVTTSTGKSTQSTTGTSKTKTTDKTSQTTTDKTSQTSTDKTKTSQDSTSTSKDKSVTDQKTQSSTDETSKTKSKQDTTSLVKGDTTSKTKETGVTQVQQERRTKTKLKTEKGDIFSRLLDGLSDSNAKA